MIFLSAYCSMMAASVHEDVHNNLDSIRQSACINVLLQQQDWKDQAMQYDAT